MSVKVTVEASDALELAKAFVALSGPEEDRGTVIRSIHARLKTLEDKPNHSEAIHSHKERIKTLEMSRNNHRDAIRTNEEALTERLNKLEEHVARGFDLVDNTATGHQIGLHANRLEQLETGREATRSLLANTQEQMQQVNEALRTHGDRLSRIEHADSNKLIVEVWDRLDKLEGEHGVLALVDLTGKLEFQLRAHDRRLEQLTSDHSRRLEQLEATLKSAGLDGTD